MNRQAPRIPLHKEGVVRHLKSFRLYAPYGGESTEDLRATWKKIPILSGHLPSASPRPRFTIWNVELI
jgi:hypothetical protein